jgi:outer membrane protein
VGIASDFQARIKPGVICRSDSLKRHWPVDLIVRDVQTAWLDANNAFTRLGITAQLLNQANESLGFAETRYKLGLASIVERSQAQLQQTEAEITNTNAQYQYRLRLAALNFQTGVQP